MLINRMIFTQAYIEEMCHAIEAMKLTPRQKEMARAVMRAAIDYANAKFGMHASRDARAAVLPRADAGGAA
jgi:hypothetical protein